MSEDQEAITSAGVYDYGLGGSNYTPAEKIASDKVLQLMPELVQVAWANRGFLQRAVTRMARDWGIRQYLDFGVGFPTQRNTHEVVSAVVPDGRVVFIETDPRVVERSQVMLDGAPGTAMVLGDPREPDSILGQPATRELIDFDQPVGLLLVGATRLLGDADDPRRMVAPYIDAIPSGSYLALSVMISDHFAESRIALINQVMGRIGGPLRTRTEVASFFDGLDVVPPYPGAEPEVTYVGLWGAEDPEAADDESSRFICAAVARKP